MSATVDDPGPDTEPIRLGKVVDNPATRQTGAGDKSSSSDSSGSSSGSDGEDDAASISTAETVDQKSKVRLSQWKNSSFVSCWYLLPLCRG